MEFYPCLYQKDYVTFSSKSSWTNSKCSNTDVVFFIGDSLVVKAGYELKVVGSMPVAKESR